MDDQVVEAVRQTANWGGQFSKPIVYILKESLFTGLNNAGTIRSLIGQRQILSIARLNMGDTIDGGGPRSYWFAGATYGGADDQMPRFIKDGIWENGYTDKYLEQVNAIQPGDRIAIKSSYTRKHDLPFDSRGQAVSVMAIKAVGTVTANHGDGRRVDVDWTELDSPKEWYFYTHRGTIWRVLPGDWASDALIAFTFEDKPQDYSRFRNAPYWCERYGDAPPEKQRFVWTSFYASFADRLQVYQDRRTDLVEAIHGLAGRVDCLSHLQDRFADGTEGPLRDICPFTTMGVFNRGITNDNRKMIAGELGQFLGVEESVPETFDGIPILNNQNSWFFGFEKSRRPDTIDVLWTAFAAAIRFADSDTPEAKSDFIKAFDEAMSRKRVAWNLTVGLYWIRPWQYVPLDTKSRHYITDRLGFEIERSGPRRRCTGADYVKLLESLEARFREDAYPVHSFPELSLAAWKYQGPVVEGEEDADKEDEEDTIPGDDGGVIEPEGTAPVITPYSVDDVLADGCFLGRIALVELLERIRAKKNVILQGPPGTGKTWLAKRLAFAVMGQRDESRVRAVQFHPNLSYEDFVRGWRPAGDGKLELVDGTFLQIIKAASMEPEAKHVLVIEEINRGHPAQIFGEMLTLLEADKRTPTEALELCYRRQPGERVFIPGNLFVIGTMNIADRSLAIVDFALRRRFAFIDLEPQFGQVWRSWVGKQYGIDGGILSQIENRILALNEQITADPTLGRQFRIGHSYVTPAIGMQIADARRWFLQVVETEIGPLLDEYWFDAPDKAREVRRQLAEGL